MSPNKDDRGETRHETTAVAKKITSLAERLLNDRESAAAIMRVKKFGDFSKEEQIAVFESDFMKGAFADWHPWRRLDNVYLSVAAARRVAEGEFESVLSEEAQGFIYENVITENRPYQELYKEPIDFDELLVILKDLSKRKDYIVLLAKWSEILLHEDAFEEFSEVKGVEKRIKRKYGITSAALLAHIMDEYRRTSFSLDDKAVVRKVVKKHLSMFTRVQGMEDHEQDRDS